MSSTAIAPVQNGALATDKSDDQYIRDHFTDGLSDRDWEMLQSEAKVRGLSIVKREIQAVKFEGVKGKVTIFPTLAGVRRIASETGKLDGSEGPYWCGPDGKWVEVWNSPTPPVAAKFILYVKGRSRPVVAVANWNEAKGEHKEYVNDRPTNKMALNAIWKKMPALMLGKTAEVHALRRSGLIGDETVWTEDDDEVGSQTVRVVENQRDTANRNLHKAVADAQLGGHPQARALTAAVNPDITSLTQASAADMNEAAGIARSMPDYAQELIEGKSRLSDPPAAVVSDAIDDERSEWRYHVEAEFAIADDPRSIGTTFLKEAKQFPWRFQDLIELAPNRAFADRYRNAAITAGVDGQIVDTAFRRFEETQQIAEQRLKDTPLAELEVSSFDKLRRALKLKEMAYAEFVDILGAAPETFGTAQVALDQYNEKMEKVGADNADTFDDIDSETVEITEPTLPGMGGDPGRYTK
jgi:hypothetical protein